MRTIAAICLALVVLIFAIYGQVAGHRFTDWDDPTYIVANEHVNSGLSIANVRWALTTGRAANWHPLTWISHMADVSLFGLDAGKHLLVNVLLHAANTVLLFLLLNRLTAFVWRSATVAALFALHPLHVESVAWASERKDVLSTLFFLLTLWTYVTYSRSRSRRAYLLTIVFFGCGLMAKSMLVTTPFVLLLLDWWPLRRGRFLLVEKLPHFGLSIVASAFALHTQHGAIMQVSLATRAANALLSYCAYLAKTAWPVGLGTFYPYRYHVATATLIACVLLLIAITAIALLLLKTRPYLLTGWLWYLGTLVPVIGIVQVGKASMADRYTYIPLIGIFLAAVWLIADVIHSRIALATIAVAATAVCAIVTFRQIGYWRDSRSLWTRAVDVTEHNPIAREALGYALLHEHDYPAAAREFRLALADAPDSPGAAKGLREAGNRQ